MKKGILTALFLAAGISAAAAADFPMITKAPALTSGPQNIWTGLYIGLNAGYGQQSNCWDMNGALVFGFNPAIPEGCHDASGALVGGQIGYRYQLGSLVFGIEAQGDWANLTGSNASTAFAGLKLPSTVSLGLTNSSKVDGIGLFTGQIGYSFGSVLWYAKGGAAVTDNKYDGALSVGVTNRAGAQVFALSAADTASAVRFGGVVGTGVDVMFAPGWTVGVEYDHLFMGSQDVGFKLTSFGTTPAVTLPGNLLKPGMPTRNDSIGGDLDMVTVRVNYRF